MCTIIDSNQEKSSESWLIKWMQLARAEGIGNATFYSLLEVYKTPQKAIEQISQIHSTTKKKIVIPPESEIIKEIESVNKLGGEIIISCQNQYSNSLLQIKDTPPVIAALGNKKLLKKPSIAIVGARAATINSCIFAKEIAQNLAMAGLNIISGLALGIDTAAHSVIYSNFDTTAVVAIGLDIIYPRENINLHKKIAKDGLIVTEVPFGRCAKPYQFTRRNRIISGLSKCVVLVEAGVKSGSLITARYATLKGKKVFAVPGSPMDQRFSGCNSALKNGAILIESTDDIIVSLKENVKGLNCSSKSTVCNTTKNIENVNYQNIQVQEVKKEILGKIDYYPVDIELLIQHLQIPNNLILIAIIELEIEKRVVRCDDNKISLLYNTAMSRIHS